VTSHVHAPFKHRRPDPQWLPQTPQLFVSLAVLAQTPPQLVVPEGHMHAPGPVLLEQVKPAAHVPQFAVGQFVPSEADPQLLVPHTDLLQPPQVPGEPLHVPEPDGHVPQLCGLPQSSTNDPHVAWSEAQVVFGVQVHVPPAPFAPLQICGATQFPQFGVLPQLSLKAPHAKPCDAQLSVALHAHVPAPFAPVAHTSGSVQVPHGWVTLHSSTNEPQLSPSDLHVVAATQLHVPLPLQWDPGPQACPQLPQLLSSLLKLTHDPLQALGVAPEHASVHALPPQSGLPVPALGPPHDVHAAPPVPLPHSVTVWPVVTQPWRSQHPAEHVAALHAAHVPLWHTRPAPHVCPSWTGTGFMHWGPAEQDCTPTWQALLFGLHCAPPVQAVQEALASHTPLAPPWVAHGVPGAAATPWSVHVATPPTQAVTLPAWHALTAGWHDVPT